VRFDRARTLASSPAPAALLNLSSCIEGRQGDAGRWCGRDGEVEEVVAFRLGFS